MSTPITLHAGLGKRIETAVDDILPYLNKAVWLIAKRLYFHGSKLIADDLDIDYTANSSTAALPADFGGLMGKPYIEGENYGLDPCPNDETRIYWDGLYGVPSFYEIVGTNMTLIPGCSAASTLKGHYFSIPTSLTATDNTLPFGTRLDDLMGEYLVEATKLRPIPEAAFQSLINSGVDDYISKMERRAPSRPKRNTMAGYFR